MPKNLKADAVYLMEALDKGEVEAYEKRRNAINYRDVVRVLKFINNDGDNILHFLVRLERFESLSQDPNLDHFLFKEIQWIFDALHSWQFIGLMTKKNKQGISPAQSAAFSMLESQEAGWKTNLSKPFSD
ncbi:MAG: hypothetical protein OXJ52_05090 [Oligoflexia bacterium]|nr:hypothetical protein [Oligoflexia bacterium]